MASHSRSRKISCHGLPDGHCPICPIWSISLRRIETLKMVLHGGPLFQKHLLPFVLTHTYASELLKAHQASVRIHCSRVTIVQLAKIHWPRWTDDTRHIGRQISPNCNGTLNFKLKSPKKKQKVRVTHYQHDMQCVCVCCRVCVIHLNRCKTCTFVCGPLVDVILLDNFNLQGFSQSDWAASELVNPSSKDVERLPSHSFSLLIIKPFLSDLTEVFFARLMHSTSVIR